jgi:hypothetical protein
MQGGPVQIKVICVMNVSELVLASHSRSAACIQHATTVVPAGQCPTVQLPSNARADRGRIELQADRSKR